MPMHDLTSPNDKPVLQPRRDRLICWLFRTRRDRLQEAVSSVLLKRKVSTALPFSHAVRSECTAASGSYQAIVIDESR